MMSAAKRRTHDCGDVMRGWTSNLGELLPSLRHDLANDMARIVTATE